MPTGYFVAAFSSLQNNHARQHGIVETLTPLRGNSRSFSEHPEALLADLNDVAKLRNLAITLTD